MPDRARRAQRKADWPSGKASLSDYLSSEAEIVGSIPTLVIFLHLDPYLGRKRPCRGDGAASSGGGPGHQRKRTPPKEPYTFVATE